MEAKPGFANSLYGLDATCPRSQRQLFHRTQGARKVARRQHRALYKAQLHGACVLGAGDIEGQGQHVRGNAGGCEYLGGKG